MKGQSARVKTAVYGECRSKIRDGDVLLYEGTNFYSWVIRTATRSRYSHAGIATWWNDRLMVMEAVGRGVVVSPLSANISHYRGHVHWYSCVRRLGPQKRRRMIIYAQSELGKEYALRRAIWVGLKRFLRWRQERTDRLHRQKKFFCSLYVAQVYNAVGLDLKLHASDSIIMPEDIARSPLLEFKGVLKEG